MAILIKKQHVLNDKYESIKFQITLHCFVKKLNLTKNEISALAILYADGINDDSFNTIINKGIFKNEQTIKNMISKLAKQGIVEKKNGVKTMTKALDVQVDDVMLMEIKIGNVS